MVNKYLPKEPEYLKKAEEISKILPGINCGACGFASCFAYAQAISKDKDTISTNPCMTMMKDEVMLKELENKLNYKISNVDMSKVAIIHCQGKSDVIYDYVGVKTCKAAAQMASGYKKCPFGCIGLGDCIKVCPENAISIDKDKKIAIINQEKCIGCGLCVSACPYELIEVVSTKLPQYLGCSYTSKLNIAGRERCDVGCTHCKICLKVSPDAVDWDEKRDLPSFIEKSKDAEEAIKKCPRNIILPLALDMKIEK